MNEKNLLETLEDIKSLLKTLEKKSIFYEKSKRLMIFIDGPNVYKGAEKNYNTKVDYLKLIKKLSCNGDYIRAYFYSSIKRGGSEALFKKLDYSGIKTVMKTLPTRGREKGIEVALATDLLALGFRNAYDIAIVVSGDGDLEDVIKRVQALGHIVKVASFNDDLSEKLRRASDENILLDDIINEIKL